MKAVGTEWEVVKKLNGLKSTEPDEDWKITYATPTYGGWDLIIECSFTSLQELDKIVTYCRVDEVLSQWIEETLTLCGTKPNYPNE